MQSFDPSDYDHTPHEPSAQERIQARREAENRRDEDPGRYAVTGRPDHNDLGNRNDRVSFN